MKNLTEEERINRIKLLVEDLDEDYFYIGISDVAYNSYKRTLKKLKFYINSLIKDVKRYEEKEKFEKTVISAKIDKEGPK